jgi:hypothetical protein
MSDAAGQGQGEVMSALNHRDRAPVGEAQAEPSEAGRKEEGGSLQEL